MRGRTSMAGGFVAKVIIHAAYRKNTFVPAACDNQLLMGRRISREYRQLIDRRDAAVGTAAGTPTGGYLKCMGCTAERTCQTSVSAALDNLESHRKPPGPAAPVNAEAEKSALIKKNPTVRLAVGFLISAWLIACVTRQTPGRYQPASAASISGADAGTDSVAGVRIR